MKTKDMAIASLMIGMVLILLTLEGWGIHGIPTAASAACGDR